MKYEDKNILIEDAKEYLSGVQDFDGYMRYLNAMSVLGRYSNIDYISMAILECPGMSNVKTKKEWEKLGIKVKDESEGILFATNEPYASGVDSWMKYDITQVEIPDGLNVERIPSGGKLLCRQAGKAVGSLKKAFETALETESNGTVDDAIIGRAMVSDTENCVSSDLSDTGLYSVCYIVRKWFGIDAFEYDLNDYQVSELPVICKCSARIIKELESKFRKMKKPERKRDRKSDGSNRSASENADISLLLNKITEIEQKIDEIYSILSEVKSQNSNTIS